jgi:hypothetical protein
MNELLSLKDALDLYQTQYSQVDKLWSYFGTFTLAVLGFTIGSEKATKSMKEVSAIIFGYLVFCIGNFGALLLGQRQLIDFSHMALKIAECQTQLFNISSLEPLSPRSISLFYWAVVTAVCFGVIFIAWKRQHAKDNQVS